MTIQKLFQFGSAAMLFLVVLVASLFVQTSPPLMPQKTQQNFEIPNAELELEAVQQVQEINERNPKFYEINQSSGLPE